MTTDITKITCRWDDQPGVEPGWYCESYDDEGELRDDSQKVWFGVQVDEYTEDDRSGLIAALKEAYPNAEIVTH